jgi:hypothetical protein
VHHDPPEVTWPLPELDVGAEAGELRPDDELLDAPELDAACRVLPDAEPDDVPAAETPGRVNATPPAAIRLAAAAETVTARSRALPRCLAAAPDDVTCVLWLMTASVPPGS